MSPSGSPLFYRIIRTRHEDRQLGDNNVSDSHLTLKQKAYHEMKEFFVIACYLWLVFGLLVLYKSVILSENHIPFAAHGLALLNAMALAKVMLIAKELRLADQFKGAPLIYPTLFRSAAFAIVLGFFKILEEWGLGWYHGKSFSESMTSIGGGTLNGILSLMLLLAVLLIPFFGFAELCRTFGEEKLVKLFFTSRHLAGNSS
jgi:hypothetical protein